MFIESAGGRKEREQAIHAFEEAHGPAIKEFRHDLTDKLPGVRQLEFLAGGDARHGPRLVLRSHGGSLEARALAGTELTPVMARWTWKSWTR